MITPPHPTRAAHRRILSLWFPRLAAEDVLRAAPGLSEAPLAVVGELGNLRQITSLSLAASARGLSRGQALAEALTLCPDLVTSPADPDRAAQLLAALRRWAGRFSPWVAEEGDDALLIDLTGCAHLFGGEAALFAQIHDDCADLGFSLCAAIADTPGAAWALARYAGGGGTAPPRSGDAIDQEARATRSRAQKRHWVKGGAAPQRLSAPQGGCCAHLAPRRLAAIAGQLAHRGAARAPRHRRGIGPVGVAPHRRSLGHAARGAGPALWPRSGAPSGSSAGGRAGTDFPGRCATAFRRKAQPARTHRA